MRRKAGYDTHERMFGYDEIDCQERWQEREEGYGRWKDSEGIIGE